MSGPQPDMATTLEMHSLYQQVGSTPKVAKAFGVTQHAVWRRFKNAGLPMRRRPKPYPFISFDGARYAPDGKDGYFRKTSGDRELLHHAMWVKAHGRIKRGWVVRFVDGDRMNVVLENLEAVPRGEDRRVTPIDLKPCLWCGKLMGRRATGDHPEGPTAYSQRKTCNAQCSAAWKKGKPKGTRMPR